MSEQEVTLGTSSALKAAVAADIARYAPELCDELPQSVILLLSALARYDGGIYHHSLRVGRRCSSLASAIGVDGEQTVRLFIAGILHDVGKIHIPRSLLHRSEPLSDEEQQRLRQHSMAGGRLLAAFPELGSFTSIVAAHHERPDGNGYPHGLLLHEIPFESLLIAVADAVDWMSHGTRTSAPLPAERICQELLRGAGTRWERQAAFAAASQFAQTGESQVPARGAARSARLPSQSVHQTTQL